MVNNMKKLSLIAVLVLFASCSCKKNAVLPVANLTSICPKDGDCKVEVFDGKSMVVKNTESESIFYELEENPAKKVVKYTYNRKVKGDIQDASYREEVIFEVPAKEEKATYNDESLQEVKLLFGRFCYCKGQTGYYKIDSGSLSISKNIESKSTAFNLNFKTEKVPQIIEVVSVLIK